MAASDVQIFTKCLLYQRDRPNETTRAASKFGVKVPTGDHDGRPALATGSADYFFTTVAGWIQGRIGVYAEGIYNLNTSTGEGLPAVIPPALWHIAAAGAYVSFSCPDLIISLPCGKVKKFGAKLKDS